MTGSMLFARLRISLICAAAALAASSASAQINPATGIKWPVGCDAINQAYSFYTKGCITVSNAGLTGLPTTGGTMTGPIGFSGSGTASSTLINMGGMGFVIFNGPPTVGCSSSINAGWLYTDSLNPFIYQCYPLSTVYGWHQLGVGGANPLPLYGTRINFYDATGLISGGNIQNVPTSTSSVMFLEAGGVTGSQSNILDYWITDRFGGVNNKLNRGCTGTECFLQTGAGHDLWFGPGCGGNTHCGYQTPILALTDDGSQLGRMGIGTVAPVSRMHVRFAPDATSNYGTVSLGLGSFDGTSLGFFAGSSSGTSLAINEVVGFLGDLANLEVGGVSAFRVSAQTFNATFHASVQAAAFQETLTTPASSSAACTAGQFTDDANFHYVCTATNTWKRAALSSF